MEHITDHAARQLSRLLQQYRDLPRLSGVLNANAAQLQAAEDAIWADFAERTLDDAIGDQLDQLGVVIGLRREGLEDEPYRLLLRATILLNRSSGTVEEILAIVELIAISGDEGLTFELREPMTSSLTADVPAGSRGEFIMRIGVSSLSNPGVVLRFLRLAKAAGVRCVLQFIVNGNGINEGSSFAFDGEGPGLGWGDGMGGSGYWVSAIEFLTQIS